MGQGPKETGLTLVVRFGDQELAQTFASCRYAGFSGAEAECEGTSYRLVSRDGLVRVLRGPSPGGEVVRLPLPPGAARCNCCQQLGAWLSAAQPPPAAH